MGNTPDIKVLVGAEGGASSSGASAQLIRSQLQKAFSQGLKIKISLGDIELGSIKAKIAQQQKAVSTSQTELNINKQLEKSFERIANIQNKTQRKDELEQAKAINKNIEQEYQLRLKNETAAKATVQQESQSYWNGRFKESLEDLTSTNDELLKMREYYSELEKSSAQQAVNQEKIQQETAKTNADANIQLASFNKYTEALNPKALTEYSAEIANIKNLFNTAATSIGDDAKSAEDDAVNALKNFKAEMKNAGYESGNAITYLEGKLKTFVTYLISSAVTMGVVTMFRNMISNIYDLDEALTDLRIVTGSTKEDAQELLDTYNEMAQTLGTTTTTVADAAVEWQRQGYSAADSNTLLTDSMALSIVGMMDETNAAKALTAAMKSYGYSVDDAITIVDKWTSLDMVSATSAGDIATASQQVATTANLVGVSLDTLSAQIAVIAETTQDGAESVGNALKTIYTRMRSLKAGQLTDLDTGEDLSNVETTLNNVGIALRKNDNEFRDLDDVLQETAEKWDTMSEVQQAAISKAMAGTYQYEKFNVLMSNYSKVLEYTEVAQDSAGTSMNKLATYEESLEAKQNRLTAAFESFSQTVVNSGLVGTILDLTTGIVNFGAGIPSVVTNVLALVAAMLLLKTTWAMLKTSKFGTAFDGTISSIKTSIAGIISSFSAVIASGGGVVGVIKLIGSSLTTLVTGHLVITTIAAIAALIPLLKKLTNLSYNNSVKAKELADSQQEAADSAQEEADSLAELISQYEELADKGTIDATTRAEVADIQKQIAALVGDQADNLDLVNGKLDDELQKLQEISAQNAEDNVDASFAAYSSQRTAAEKAAGEGEALGGLISGKSYVGSNDKAAYNILKGFTDSYGNQVVSTGGFAGSQIFVQDVGSAAENVKILTQMMDALKNDADYDISSEFYTGLQQAKQYYEGFVTDVETAADSLVTSVTESAYKQKDLAGDTIDSAESYDQYRQSLINAAMASEELSAAMVNGDVTIQDVESAVDDLMATQFPEWYDKVNTSSQGAVSSTSVSADDLTTSLTNLKNAQEAYESVQDDISSDGEVSLDTLISLIDTYPDLTDVVDKYIRGEATATDVLNAVNVQYQNVEDSVGRVENATSSAVDVMQTKIDALTSAQDEYSKSGLLTESTANSLIAVFPQLESALTKTEYGYKLSTDASTALGDATDVLANMTTSAQAIITNAVDTGVSARLSAYGIELDAIGSLSDAWSAISSMNQSIGTGVLRNELRTDPEAAKEYQEMRNTILAIGTAREKIQSLLDNFSSKWSSGGSSSSGSGSSDTTDPWEEARNSLDDYLEEQERAIKLLQYQGAETDALVAKYKAMQTRIHELAESYRKQTGIEEDDYTRQLSLLWWGYYDDINEMSEDSASERLDDLEDQKENIEDIIDLTKDLIEQEQNDLIDSLNDEIDAYSEIISLKKKSLELTQEENSYQDSVDSLNSDISKLQAQIDTLSLDNSREAQAQRAGLLEQLAEKQKDLADTQSEYSVTKQEDALDDDLENFEDAQNEKIDKIKDFLDDNEALTKAAMNRIDTEGDALFDDLLSYALHYTDTTQAELVSMWDAATDAVNEYGSALNAVSSINAQIDVLNNGTSASSESMNAIVSQMKINSSKWYSADSTEKTKLANLNKTLGNSLGATIDHDGVWWLNGKKLYEYTFHTGTPSAGQPPTPNQSELWALVKKGETILTQKQQNGLLGLIKGFASSLSFASGISGSASNVASSLQSATSSPVYVDASVSLNGAAALDDKMKEFLEKYPRLVAEQVNKVMAKA